MCHLSVDFERPLTPAVTVDDLPRLSHLTSIVDGLIQQMQASELDDLAWLEGFTLR